MTRIADFHGYEGPRYPLEPWTEDDYPLFLVKAGGELVYMDPRDVEVLRREREALGRLRDDQDGAERGPG
jgi:hypothetical protein